MPAQQREHGRRLLMTEIRRAGQIPRIELAERTGLSRATVTTITAEFLQEGFIEEVPRPAETADAPRGRPRVDLKLRGAARLVAGAQITNKVISLVLLDMEGTQLAEHEAPLPLAVFPPAELANRVAGAVSALVLKAGVEISALSGVGVGIAGIVDASNGFVHWSPSLSERNVEFANLLKLQLGRPAFIDNDANLVALAELSFGLGRGLKDFIVITIESGVGMGIVLGGALYRGTRGCGAELGHTKVQLDGALCRCGQRGCLEAYVADYALLREAELHKNLPRHATDEARINALLTDARSGEPVSCKILDQAGRMFAMGLANLVNIFDPELIILAGEEMQFEHLFAQSVIDAMRDSIVQVDKAPPEVVVHTWGNLMWARGAAAYALDNIIDHALTELGTHAA